MGKEGSSNVARSSGSRTTFGERNSGSPAGRPRRKPRKKLKARLGEKPWVQLIMGRNRNASRSNDLLKSFGLFLEMKRREVALFGSIQRRDCSSTSSDKTSGQWT